MRVVVGERVGGPEVLTVAERLARLARLPVLRSMTRRLLAVLDEVLG